MIPRCVCAIDLKNDSARFSPITGSPSYQIQFYDINEDGYLEIFSNSNALNNFEGKNINYKDDRPWLKVLTNDLKFSFEPIPYPPGEGSSINCIIDNLDGLKRMVVLYHNRNALDNKSYLVSLDTKWEKLYKTDIELSNIPSSLKLFKYGSKYLIFMEPNELIVLNRKLEVLKKYSLRIRGRFPFLCDIDENGRQEFILLEENREGLIIISDNFRKYNILEFDKKVGFQKDFFKLEKSKFYLTSNSYTYFYDYRFNHLYYLKYPFIFVIYLIFTLILRGLKVLYEKQISNQYKLKESFRDLQLKFIRNQFEPHFTFNALNTLAGVSEEGDSRLVAVFISKFSKLLRTHLESSELTSVTLEQELEFVKNYVELQKIRFKNKLEMQVSISESVDMWLPIPKMIVQIHVENAIKHGILPKKGSGKIQINIDSVNNETIITIVDNGIGRNTSIENRSQSTLMGLKILEKIFYLFYEIYNVRITQRIIDLIDNGKKPIGTKIELIIPEKR